ncbi:unnamed protein product [Cuscuta epithymum]|uniref:Uncharacterized protein n=1 Tax=Cuscuta epithymum TaxID=186058 RepID=A0AAV0F1C8_9ASTE|nr:unnamed protein product [Cuscuta epithymum]
MFIIHFGLESSSDTDPEWWLHKKYDVNLVSNTYDGLVGLEEDSGKEVSLASVSEEEDVETGSEVEGTDEGLRKRGRLNFARTNLTTRIKDNKHMLSLSLHLCVYSDFVGIAFVCEVCWPMFVTRDEFGLVLYNE